MDEYWGELKRCDDNEEGLGKFFTNKLTKSKYLFGRGQGFFLNMMGEWVGWV